MDKLTLNIERTKARMKVKPECPYCGTTMMFRQSALGGAGISQPTGSPIRDDQNWKCPNCFHIACFGIPITKDEALFEKCERGNSLWLLMPRHKVEERFKKGIMERLKALGYLDFE